ncbi:hypothetical protein DPMN_057609 [Dreissena polymorpha]|uniref:Uncharacterized protein n=1 Tax=Dreissena polymorpha TaxID=45954 RepID=A0A9D4C0J5_DREPO|nr:hypothetical protein DPMN_057609 [Dreissena polymorpha]
MKQNSRNYRYRQVVTENMSRNGTRKSSRKTNTTQINGIKQKHLRYGQITRLLSNSRCETNSTQPFSPVPGRSCRTRVPWLRFDIRIEF